MAQVVSVSVLSIVKVFLYLLEKLEVFTKLDHLRMSGLKSLIEKVNVFVFHYLEDHFAPSIDRWQV